MKTAGLLLGAITVAAVGFGFGTNGQDVPIWQKIGNKVEIFPRTTTVDVGLFTQGGGEYATTSKGTVTYAASNFINYSVIKHTPDGAAQIASLPASPTLATLIPNAGDFITKFIYNNGTTTLTIAGATGLDLNFASTSEYYTPTLGASGVLKLEFFRKSNTDIEVFGTFGTTTTTGF
jgi:hypothetical protein